MKRTILILVSAFILLSFVFINTGKQAVSASPSTGESQAAFQQSVTSLPTDQIIVKYKASVGGQAMAASTDMSSRLNEAAGMPLQFQRNMSGEATVYRLPQRMAIDEVKAVAAKLMVLPEVVYAEPDQIMVPFATTPNDPQYPNQWHYFAPAAGHYGIDMPDAWDITQGASNVVVAVVDTGITDHADLAGRSVPGYDFISNALVANDGDGRDSDPHDPGDWIDASDLINPIFNGCQIEDSSWHGTHVAGTIGAASNNGLGVAGINWNSKILPVRVLGKCGGFTSDIADGIRWAAGLSVTGVPANGNPAKVISLSLGGSGSCSSTYQDAINAVIAAGATMVVAAGNSNADVSGFNPASCNGVISVAATDRYGDRAYYSNYGSLIKISAPGGAQSIDNDPDGVLSTLNTGATVPAGDTYIYYQGTSMATPHVSGVVSLLYSLNPSITPAQVLQILQNTVTAFPSGSTCTTSNCGSGILNAGNAVKPRISSLVPSTAIIDAGPLTLTVHGFNFNNTSTIKWDGTAITTTFVSSMQLQTTLTAANLHTSGKHNVTVATTFSTIGVYETTSLPFTVSSTVVYLPQLYKPSTPSPLVNGNFESGATGWTQYSSNGYQLILNTGFPGTITPHSGVYAVWLGGDYNEISSIQQQLTLDPATPYLAYWHWIASAETTCGNDFGGVMVNGAWLDKYNLCESTNTGGWVKHVVNLSAYAGQTITFQIRGEADAALNSNLFIDDVALQSTASLLGSEQSLGQAAPGETLLKPQSLR